MHCNWAVHRIFNIQYSLNASVSDRICASFLSRNWYKLDKVNLSFDTNSDSPAPERYVVSDSNYKIFSEIPVIYFQGENFMKMAFLAPLSFYGEAFVFNKKKLKTSEK